MLPSKCASRHKSVHDIATSKNAPNVKCFYHFSLANVRRATTACTFSTSELPKVVRTWPNVVCFVHFDFEACFTPQQCALFRHLNSQKWSDAEVFCTFDFELCFAPQRRALFLPSELRTRRLSEPTFRPSGTKSLEKQCLATFLPCRAPGSSFF